MIVVSGGVGGGEDGGRFVVGCCWGVVCYCGGCCGCGVMCGLEVSFLECGGMMDVIWW